MKRTSGVGYRPYVAKSVSYAREVCTGYGPWRLLETIRAYALEILAESGESEQVARRCPEFFRDLVGPAFHGSQEPPAVEETPHLRSASAMLQSLPSHPVKFER